MYNDFGKSPYGHTMNNNQPLHPGQQIPASRIADVNRGIFMPLSAASDRPLTITLTLEVHSEEGITPATLENKVKETIRQIGARVEVEETA
jgi:hypothetical protein